MSPRLRSCFAFFGLAASLAITGGYAATTIAFQASQYFPLGPGNRWDYRVTATGVSSAPVRAGSATVLDGTTSTRQVELEGFGTSREFYTNNHAGLRLHRFDEGNTQHTFTPPIDILGAQFTEGDSVSTSGGHLVIFSNGNTRGGTYESTARVLPSTTITVPLGTFRVEPIEITITESSTVDLGVADVTLVITYKRNFWLAQHAGPIRQFHSFRVETQPPITYSALLTSISIDSDSDGDGTNDGEEVTTGRDPHLNEGMVVFLVTNTLLNDVRNSETTVNISRCNDPRPQVCTLDFQPVCGFSTGDAGCTEPTCPSVEWRTYSNACDACTDANVHGYRPGAC